MYFPGGNYVFPYSSELFLMRNYPSLMRQHASLHRNELFLMGEEPPLTEIIKFPMENNLRSYAKKLRININYLLSLSPNFNLVRFEVVFACGVQLFSPRAAVFCR